MNMKTNRKVLVELHLSTLRTSLGFLTSEYNCLMLDLDYKGYCHRTDREIKMLRQTINELNEALSTWG